MTKNNKIYYVYGWFDDETHEIIYIGKGKGRRYKETKDRNPKFKAYINKHKCSPKILWGNLDEETAYKNEKMLISLYRNEKMSKLNFHDGGDRPPKMTDLDHPNSRQVIQLSKEGEFIKQWTCLNRVAEFFKVKSNSLISRACKKGTSAYGFLWVYLEEYNPNKNYAYKPKTVAKPILQFNEEGDFIKEWESAMQVHKELGLQRSTLSGALKGHYKTCGGYKWKYKNESL